jgi:hypothetical protein
MADARDALHGCQHMHAEGDGANSRSASSGFGCSSMVVDASHESDAAAWNRLHQLSPTLFDAAEQERKQLERAEEEVRAKLYALYLDEKRVEAQRHRALDLQESLQLASDAATSLQTRAAVTSAVADSSGAARVHAAASDDSSCWLKIKSDPGTTALSSGAGVAGGSGDVSTGSSELGCRPGCTRPHLDSSDFVALQQPFAKRFLDGARAILHYYLIRAEEESESAQRGATSAQPRGHADEQIEDDSAEAATAGANTGEHGAALWQRNSKSKSRNRRGGTVRSGASSKRSGVVYDGKRANFSSRATFILKKWLHAHIQDPYPSAEGSRRAPLRSCTALRSACFHSLCTTLRRCRVCVVVCVRTRSETFACTVDAAEL